MELKSPNGGTKELFLRIFQHTPGTYQNDPEHQQFMFRNSFHLGVWGGLGYAPGVCWGFLRLLDDDRTLFCLKMMKLINQGIKNGGQGLSGFI